MHDFNNFFLWVLTTNFLTENRGSRRTLKDEVQIKKLSHNFYDLADTK